ncbi:MAG: PAS domain-containing protein, partial [Bdellovibrionales bacterium]
MNQVLNSKQEFLIEIRLLSLDSKFHWFSVRLFLNPQTDSVFVVARDIHATTIKLKRLEKIEKATGVGAWEIDLSSKELYWSENCHQIHGTDPNTYKPVLEDGISFYHADSLPRLREVVTKIMQSGEPYDEELKFLNINKELRFVRVIGRAELSEGHVRRVFGTIEDITEKKQQLEATLGLSETFRAIVYNIPLMISFFNEKGEFEWVNPAWVEILGWDVSDMKNKDMLL